MAFDVHEVANSHNDFLDLLSQLTGRSEDQGLAGLEAWVDLLEAGDGEGGGFASAGLSLRNDVAALNNRHLKPC